MTYVRKKAGQNVDPCNSDLTAIHVRWNGTRKIIMTLVLKNDRLYSRLLQQQKEIEFASEYSKDSWGFAANKQCEWVSR